MIAAMHAGRGALLLCTELTPPAVKRVVILLMADFFSFIFVVGVPHSDASLVAAMFRAELRLGD
jgi:hypothetical protein